MSDRIYLSSPDVGPAEEAAVVGAMRSGWIAPLGPAVDAFEHEIASRTRRGHAVALSSGTAALHLALIGLGVRPGDVVVTASMTFVATANAIMYVGAEPVFVDSDPSSGNIDVGLLEKAIVTLRSEGRQIGAILPVDLLGKVADYVAIEELAARFGIPVLADAAESLGASLDGRPAGSFGAAAALSFNGNKVMTTSGGGMLLTDDEKLASRARYLATQARQPVIHYEHTTVGYNYRLSNLLAALGLAQVGRLDDMIARRRSVREMYRELFASTPGVSLFGGEGDVEDNCWLTSIVIDSSVAGWSPEDLRSWLANDNIESRPLWKPMHRQPLFASARAFVTGVSDNLFEQGLTLPSGSALTSQELDRVQAHIAVFLERL